MKEQNIKWQFAPEFYKSLNLTMDQIRAFFWAEEYELTLKGLRLVWDIIRQMAKDDRPEDYKEIDGLLIKTIDSSIIYMNQALIYSVRTKLPPKIKIRLTKQKWELEANIHNLHGRLWSAMFKLNMVLPFEKKDNRLPIYQ